MERFKKFLIHVFKNFIFDFGTHLREIGYEKCPGSYDSSDYCCRHCDVQDYCLPDSTFEEL